MQKVYLCLRTILYATLTLFTGIKSIGQVSTPSKLSIRNFAVFGGFVVNSNPAFFTDSINFGVNINPSGSINGGAIGSYSFITTGFNVSLQSNIYSGHRIHFDTANHIMGNVTAAINGNQNTNVITTNGGVDFGGEISNGFFQAELIANGNILVDPFSTNIGAVRIPAGNTYNGPSPENGVFNNPTFPQLPAIPTNVPWGAPGVGANFFTTATINPGTYSSIVVSGGQTMTFNGPGRYIFDSIKSNNATQNTFIFDFKNNETGIFALYVNRNVDLRNIQVLLVNGGSASRIYTEVHGIGNNNGYAFSIDGGPATLPSNWEGTVWAPVSKIRIGVPAAAGSTSSTVNGCLWSAQMVRLYGQSTVNYVPLSLSGDPAQTISSPIIPYYPPPADGKVNKVIGSELQSLFENYNPATISPNDFIYRIDKTTNKVLIEVIAKQGQYSQLLSALVNTYGLTDIISNGEGSLIITGKFPIANLSKLNTDPISARIDYCRPLFMPLTNSGLVTTLGDSAMKAGLVRKGYNLSGAGIKVGVLSDSYDRALPNPASTTATGDLGQDLPPSVQVLQDYPFGNASDEGRAMMQIVHDVAPGADLAFRTGFISAGDMAMGIDQLASDCKIIVDDVTYITEPFMKDGTIARAVNSAVANRNVTYFSAAGNFGKKAYDGVFSDITPPIGFSGLAHDFGSGNYLQRVTLQPGTYTLVLQWVDDIYSLGETTNGGTQNDLDIYLMDDQGTILFGFNRVNTGGDPLEVLPFTVNGNTPVNGNLMIVMANGTTPNLAFKYVAFRGGLSFSDYPGASTLVGQANAANSIAVGAVRYDKTPPFGVTPSVIEDYSSLGGTLVSNVNRNKPDLTAPTGGNVTVNIGPDFDGDTKANFFGTSAAAPHAAAVAALIKEGKQKFSAATITPAQMKTLLKSTATDIGLPGFDALTGSGLVNADAAMRTFANPQPFLSALDVVEPAITPGLAPFTVSVKGKNLSPTTIINFNGNPVATAFVNTEELRAPIPTFSGNAFIQLFTPPISSSNLDGGFSEKKFFQEVPKRNITITVNDKTKKFGETLPAFTATVLVDGVALANSGLTLTALKLNNLTFSTTATSASQVGLYPITVANPIDPNNPADQLLLQQYNYQFNHGVLQIQRLPLKITPKDKIINYGNYPDITFTYTFDRTKMTDAAAIELIIKTQHKKFLAENAIVVANGFKLPQANGAVLTNADLLNMSTMASFQAVRNARKFVLRNGQMLPLVNPLTIEELGSQRFVVDVSAQSIFNYKLNPASSPLVTAFTGEHSRLLLNAKSLATGAATTKLNNGQLQGMVNGQLMAVVNGQLQAIVNGQLMAIVNGELSVLENVVVLTNGQLQAVVNGVLVTIPNGQLQAIVNGQLFLVTNPVMVNGQLQGIVNGQLMAVVNGQLMAIVNGQLMPVVNGQLQAIVNGQLMAIVNGQLQAIVNGQLMAIVNGQLVVTGVSIVNGQLQAIVNGQLQAIVNGQLQALVNGEVYPVGDVNLLNGQLQAIVNGQLMGIVNGQLQAIVNGQLQAIVNANNLGGVNSNNNTAVVVDQDDVNLQGGSIGAMFSINMITGMEEGVQSLVPGAFGHENYDVTYGLGKVTILPATDYYTRATGDLHNVLSWGANVDGSGANPVNFAAGKTFHLVNRTSPYAMTADWTVEGKLDIPQGSQLRINGFTLSEGGLAGSGNLYGSPSSNLVVTGSTSGDAGLLNFASGGGDLNNLTINRTGSSGSATIGTALNIYNVLTITKGTLKTGNKLTLKSTADNTARLAPLTGGISGNVTVERFIPARRAWRIMSAPVAGSQRINAAWQEGVTTASVNPNPNPGFGTHITEGSAANGFDHNPVGGTTSINKYVSASDSWVPLTNTSATNVNATAYLLFVRGHRGTPLNYNNVPPTPTVLRANGALKTGNQTFTVSANGFTAIPNPYASPINFATITRNNVQNNFYLWDPKIGGEYGVGGYVLVSYNGTGYDITPAPASPESQFIQSGQGFLVHSTGIAGSIVIKESDKSATASANVFRGAYTTKGLHTSLQIANKDKTTSVLDEVFSSYGQTFSNKVDNMDPVKLSNINENLGIVREGQTLMIERRQVISGNDTIHLKLWNTVQRDYLLQFSPENLSSTSIVEAYLEDKFLRTSMPISLTDTTRIKFNVVPGTASASDDRFMIVLSSGKNIQAADNTLEITKRSFKLSPNPVTGKVINIQFINQPKGNYKIELVNNMGQVVYQGKMQHAGGSVVQTIQLSNKIVKGVYQMRIINEQAKISDAIPVISN